jgi:hypothetical protein
MKKTLHGLIVALPLLFAACAAQEPTPAEPAAPAAQPYANLNQLMRAIPFIHSNVVFDTQSNDPEGPDIKMTKSFMVYSLGDTDVYAKWSGVEASALAIAETANLLLVPGRKCLNGLDVPVDRADWKMYVEGLAAAGRAAYEAAQTKNMDRMLEVSETLTLACSACHDVYRDVDQQGMMRCVPPAEGAAPAAPPAGQ